jgi:cytochrome c556
MKGTAMKVIARVVVPVLIVAFVFGAAYAQFAKPKDAIDYRKAVMTLIGQNIKWMGAVVQGKADYKKDEFSTEADAVELLATLPWKAMTEPGSDKGDTTMTSAVFDKEEQFMEDANGFETAAAKLATAARGGDLNAVKAQFGQVVKFCKSCHTEFRKK